MDIHLNLKNWLPFEFYLSGKTSVGCSQSKAPLALPLNNVHSRFL